MYLSKTYDDELKKKKIGFQSMSPLVKQLLEHLVMKTFDKLYMTRSKHAAVFLNCSRSVFFVG